MAEREKSFEGKYATMLSQVTEKERLLNEILRLHDLPLLTADL